MNELFRLKTLQDHGFSCSQMLVQMGLDLQGKTSPEALRAVRGLSGGIGDSRGICGALTGGACLLGLYAGKSLPDEEQDERLNLMIQELIAWFKATWGTRYGGVECAALLEGDMENAAQRCPDFVIGVYQKAKDLLVAYGYDLHGADGDD